MARAHDDLNAWTQPRQPGPKVCVKTLRSFHGSTKTPGAPVEVVRVFFLVQEPSSEQFPSAVQGKGFRAFYILSCAEP